MSAPLAPALRNTPRIASCAASHQFSGRCSAQSGRSMRMSSWRAVKDDFTSPAFVHEKRARPARTDIDSKPVHLLCLIAPPAAADTRRRISRLRSRAWLSRRESCVLRYVNERF